MIEILLHGKHNVENILFVLTNFWSFALRPNAKKKSYQKCIKSGTLLHLALVYVV